MTNEVRTGPAGLPGHIVAATDFSSAGDEAEQRACLLAMECGARLTLVHVVPTSPWEGVGARLATLAGVDVPSPAAMREQAGAQLERRAQELSGRFAVACDARVVEGRPAAELARLASESGADVLVVGVRGTSALRGARDILLGSTAQKLLRIAPCPVLVVKRTAASPYRRVLAPTDYSTPARRAVRVAAAWFPAAQLHLAHAFELPFDGMLRRASIGDEVVAKLRSAERDQLQQRLADWADAADVAPQRRALHVEHGYAPRCIDDWIESTRADVLVIAAHGKSELEAALLGSVTMHVVVAARCDVLLVRGAEAG